MAKKQKFVKVAEYPSHTGGDESGESLAKKYAKRARNKGYYARVKKRKSPLGTFYDVYQSVYKKKK